MLCEYCEKEINDEAVFCQHCGHNIVVWKLEPGTKLHHGRYEVIEPLGSGGMASVYLAEDLNLDNTPCVLKVMTDEFRDAKERKYAIGKFKEEAVMLARLRHTNLPVVQNHFLEDGRYYLVMDHIEGDTLDDIVNSTIEDECFLAEELVIEWMKQICDVLHYLHTRDPMIIHRDVKPDNLMEQEEDGRIMLLDFGVASKPTKKDTGTLVGTPGYASPEQYLGKAYPQSDIFALGATFHRLLTGYDPAEDDEADEDPTSLFIYPPLSDFRDDLTPGLEKIIARATDLEVENRYPTAKAFKEALIQLKEKPEELRPKKRFPGPRVGKGRGIIKETDNVILKRKGPGLGIKKPSPKKPTGVPIVSDKLKLRTDLTLPVLKQKMAGIAALDIGTHEIKLLVLDIDGNGHVYPKVIAADKTPEGTVERGVILNPKGLSKKLIPLMKSLGNMEIVTSISPYCLSMRTLKIPVTPEEKVPSMFSANLDQLIPIPVDRCYMNYEIVTPSIPGDEGNMRVRITAILKDAYDNLNKTMYLSALSTDKILLEPVGLAELAKMMIIDEEKKKDVAIINIGMEGTSVSLIKDEILSQTLAFTHGGKTLTKALMQAERLSYGKAEEVKRTECSADLTYSEGKSATYFQILLPHFKDWATEILKSLRFFGPEYRLNKFKSVIFCGGGIQLRNLHKHLSSQLKITSDKFVFPKSKDAKLNMKAIKEKEPSLMPCMGLAISPYIDVKYFKPDKKGAKIKHKKKKKSLFGSLFGMG